jgi:hypothetical protein
MGGNLQVALDALVVQPTDRLRLHYALTVNEGMTEHSLSC